MYFHISQSADELFIEECLAVENANKSNYSFGSGIKKLEEEKLERQRNQQLLIENLVSADAV